ncbi:MAG: serine acetyltransferase [Bacteroidales bacterium]|jgi:serine O-acetyltransferase|nr:serine acetyltransferase [Bacteroidales bacterium]
MHNVLKNIKFFLEFIRCFPHLIIFYLHRNNSIIRADVIRSLSLLEKRYSIPVGFIYLLSFHKPFRNVFYFRIGTLKSILNIFCSEISSLYIYRNQTIGEGLFIWHGYATLIGSKSIGENCTINQQVTIGTFNGYPTILDNVTINSGAIVVGDITIGNNSVIGANATVFQDVPDNCTVYPAQSKIMQWNHINDIAK